MLIKLRSFVKPRYRMSCNVFSVGYLPRIPRYTSGMQSRGSAKLNLYAFYTFWIVKINHITVRNLHIKLKNRLNGQDIPIF